MAASGVALWASVAADAVEAALLVVVEVSVAAVTAEAALLAALEASVAAVAALLAVLLASVAALATLGLQLTPDGVIPLVLLEPGARWAMEGLVGVRCGRLLLGNHAAC